MQRKEDLTRDSTPREAAPLDTVHTKLTSKKVSDHLANERTFLAWVRTGLATMAFGFAVERIGLALRELGLKNQPIPDSTIHYSTFVGVTLVILGTVVLAVSLPNFLLNRRAIDREEFHPQATLPIILTAIAVCIGIVLAVYLALTS